MKYFLETARRFRIQEVLLVCLFLGVVLGTVSANLLKGYYINQFFLFDDSYLLSIQNADMDCFIVFQMAFVNYIKEFGLLVLLCTTMLGTPYILFHCTYKGFCVGFIVSTAIMRYGIKGILFFICYISPQCLTYIPLLILTYLKGCEYNRSVYSKNDGVKGLYRKYLPYLLFLVIMIGITSLLEGYINTSLLRMIMVKLVS